MTEFIQVLGDDPKYTGKKTHQYVASHIIQRVVPVYCVKDEKGVLWVSHEEHEGAIRVTYRLFDAFDKEYWCSDEEELSKLGVPIAHTQRAIGFIHEKEGDGKIAIDINTEL